MALVTAAAFFMAVLFLLFKVFDRRGIDLLPAIVVNYFAAFVCGTLVAPPWHADDLSPLWVPGLVLGLLFITVFYLTGLSSQRAGVAATAVASKMSLVLTVLFAVYLYGDRPGAAGWAGIALALVGVALASWVPNRAAVRVTWSLPTLLFLGNAVIDIAINWVQRTRLTEDTLAVFPTMVFAVAGALGTVWVLSTRGVAAFVKGGTWAGGAVLGVTNYAALYFVVRALDGSGLPSSGVYALVNILVILIGTALSMLLFHERPRRSQVVGIACSVAALALLLTAL
jgi:drug/metabolite transporter (DMT)-like permease